MTNKELITMNKALLLAEGIIEEDTILHTCKFWNECGYKIIKGEKATAKFAIWKYTNKKKKDMTEEEAQEKGYCFMHTAAWFTEKQVEPFKKEEK